MTPTCYFCATPTPTDTCPQCQQPQVLRGTYRLLKVLGQGGFGVVYQARDTRFERLYAIKVINSLSAADQRLVQSEAEILARYARQFTFMPEIYDHWTEGSRTYLVMEYIAGQTLGQLQEKHGRVTPIQARQVLQALLQHLHELHEAGIVHRDIKPDNITLTPDGRYVLLDFGISKQHAMTMTAAKAISPYYSSPEQTLGQPTDARSDLYSLGATVYHLLTGETPPQVSLRRVNRVPVTPPQRLIPSVDAALNRTLLALLEADPAQRPASAQAALDMLHQPVPTVATGPTRRMEAPMPQYYPASPAPLQQQRQQNKLRAMLSLLVVGAFFIVSCVSIGTAQQRRADTVNSKFAEIDRMLSDGPNFERAPEVVRREPTAVPPPPIVNPLEMDLKWQAGQQDSELQYAIIEDVYSSKYVEPGKSVTVQYQLYTHEGQDDDNNPNPRQVSFVVGDEHIGHSYVTRGLDPCAVT